MINFANKDNKKAQIILLHNALYSEIVINKHYSFIFIFIFNSFPSHFIIFNSIHSFDSIDVLSASHQNGHQSFICLLLWIRCLVFGFSPFSGYCPKPKINFTYLSWTVNLLYTFRFPIEHWPLHAETEMATPQHLRQQHHAGAAMDIQNKLKHPAACSVVLLFCNAVNEGFREVFHGTMLISNFIIFGHIL